MAFKDAFDQETRRLRSKARYAPFNRLRIAQRYALEELRTVYGQVEEKELKRKIDELHSVFAMSLPAAVYRKLDTMRKRNIRGMKLFTMLDHIHRQHRLDERYIFQQEEARLAYRTRIVCSEWL